MFGDKYRTDLGICSCEREKTFATFLLDFPSLCSLHWIFPPLDVPRPKDYIHGHLNQADKHSNISIFDRTDL